MTNKTKMKGWKKALLIVLSVFLGLAIILLGAIGYFTFPVASYYSASEKAFSIPGTNDGAVAQGLHYDETSGKFLSTAYYSKSNTVIFVIDEKTNTSKRVNLAKENGKAFTKHSGGVAVYGEYVFVAGSGDGVYVFPYDEIMDCADGATVKCLGLFDTNFGEDNRVKSSFVTVYGNKMLIGEFYDRNSSDYNYEVNHKFTTEDNQNHFAYLAEFNLDADAYPDSFGICLSPSIVYSVRDCVQGVAVDDGKIYLSTSYGASFSNVYAYDLSKLQKDGDVTILNTTAPLYSLDSRSLVKTYKLAPMAEEIAFVNGYMYTMCESASNKYVFGKLLGADWCYKTDLSKM